MADTRCARCCIAILDSDFRDGLAELLSGMPHCRPCLNRVAERQPRKTALRRIRISVGAGIALFMVWLTALIIVLVLIGT